MSLFPFSGVREGQKELLELIGHAVGEGKHVVSHAPTGIGKTVAALAPALEYALDNKKTLLFMTPRHTQHKMVIDTLKTIKETSGRDFRVVDIIGKRWLCNQQAARELSGGDFHEYCRALRKDKLCVFFEACRSKTGELSQKAKDALSKLDTDVLHSEEAISACRDVCVYELVLEAARKADVIVADYYHLFHPIIRNAFLKKTGKSLEDLIIVVDEAHNLPERMRGMMTFHLTDKQLRLASKEANRFGYDEVSKNLNSLRRGVEELTKDIFGYQAEVERFMGKDELMDVVEEFKEYGRFAFELDSIADKVRESQRKSFIGGVSGFLDEWSRTSEAFTRILRTEKDEMGDIHYRLSYECLDPSVATDPVFRNVHSAIIMSGTLTPTRMYMQLLGLPEERTARLRLKSPFPKENRLNLIVDKVTTKYKYRTDTEFMRIAGQLVKVINHADGNVGVFFPSYGMRDTVYGILERSIEKRALLEHSGMTKEEKKNLFRDYVNLAENGGGVLLGVVGASFSEGVDFLGEHMKTVVVVGLPLQPPDLSVKALVEYYDRKFNKGWDYGYVYPAMNRVVQAAGRCIRSPTDRGVIVLMDKRFTWKHYKRVLPRELDFKVSGDISGEIEDFFRKT